MKNTLEPEIHPIPSEYIGIDKRFLKLKHHDVLMSPPFTCCVCGSIGSGKTSFAYSMINEHYKGYFDEVIVLCATKDSQKSWESINQKRVIFLNELDEESLQQYLHQLEEDQEERKSKGKFPIRVLLLMDDAVFQSLNKNRSGVIEKLFMVCRHYFVSIMLLLQHSKMVSPAIRNQIMYWILFRLTANDQAKIATEHSNLLKTDQFEKMYLDVMKSSKYAYLMIDYKSPLETRFRNGMTKVIDIEPYKH